MAYKIAALPIVLRDIEQIEEYLLSNASENIVQKFKDKFNGCLDKVKNNILKVIQPTFMLLVASNTKQLT